MSRTYRRKGGDQSDLVWRTSKMVKVPGRLIWYWEKMDPNSKEYKQEINKWHSDYGTAHYSRSAPGWWITLTSQRPYRRDSKRKIQKWLLDPEYEVIINSKEPLPYWD
jgi:hypothetical protein